tara:strand:- start:146 stop:289 length:144 start_codon:yes stop_codon:yes gene_type:complete
MLDYSKMNGLHELGVVQRALKRCKWYEFHKKRTLRVHKELIIKIYEL